MKSSASAVRVAIKIDPNRYELLAALAALRGKTVEELISFFLVNGLIHPPLRKVGKRITTRHFFTRRVESPRPRGS